jgi:urease subunit gamma/beta
MQLTPSERDRLLIFTAAQLAKSRRDRGLLLNLPEAIAIISDAVIEAARGGDSHATALMTGINAVRADQLLPGVAPMLVNISVEGVFDDGRRVVVIPGIIHSDADEPGAVTRLTPMLAPTHPDSNTVVVTNESTLPISVTSHLHFFEANPRLRFDRAASYGRHLLIPAGDHVDFLPGVPVEVALAPIAGKRIVVGFAGLVDGPLDAPGAKENALAKAREFGYLDTEQM